jgi:hypothetical protein
VPASSTDAMLPAEPAHTTAGALIVADGGALMATDCEPDAEHPVPVMTVTPKVTTSVVPAVNDTDRVPLPEVIVPLAIDHV